LLESKIDGSLAESTPVPNEDIEEEEFDTYDPIGVDETLPEHDPVYSHLKTMTGV